MRKVPTWCLSAGAWLLMYLYVGEELLVEIPSPYWWWLYTVPFLLLALGLLGQMVLGAAWVVKLLAPGRRDVRH